MNRYFFYLILLNMLVNVIVYIPNILFNQRYEGAVMAIAISIPIGIAISFLFVKSISKFPEKGLPEILDLTNYKWLKKLLLSYISIMWFLAGTITFIANINIIKEFINPEISSLSLLFLLYLILIYVIQLKSIKVLYLLEIILLLNVPFIGYIFMKSIINEFFKWDAVIEVGTYIFQPPSLSSISAATYVFSGYLNLLIFHRVFKNKIKLKWFWIILVASICNLWTTFFVPIGYQGADGIGEYTYPWITTADSLRIEFGPIERVISLFLMLYMSISLLSISIHWHVALNLMKSVFSYSTVKRERKISWSIILCFVFMSLGMVYFISENQLFSFTESWLQIRFISEISLVFIVFWLARRYAK